MRKIHLLAPSVIGPRLNTICGLVFSEVDKYGDVVVYRNCVDIPSIVTCRRCVTPKVTPK